MVELRSSGMKLTVDTKKTNRFQGVLRPFCDLDALEDDDHADGPIDPGVAWTALELGVTSLEEQQFDVGSVAVVLRTTYKKLLPRLYTEEGWMSNLGADLPTAMGYTTRLDLVASLLDRVGGEHVLLGARP